MDVAANGGSCFMLLNFVIKEIFELKGKRETVIWL